MESTKNEIKGYWNMRTIKTKPLLVPPYPIKFGQISNVNHKITWSFVKTWELNTPADSMQIEANMNGWCALNFGYQLRKINGFWLRA